MIVENHVVAVRIDLRRFAKAVREMMDAQQVANEPGAISHEVQIAMSHEQHVRQWIRTITAETLAHETEGRAAA